MGAIFVTLLLTSTALQTPSPPQSDTSAPFATPAVRQLIERHEIRRLFGEIHPHQRLSGLFVGIEHTPVDVEHDDALAEAVEQRLGER